MPMSSKFLTESIGEKSENWSIFNEDMDKVGYDSLLFFGPPCTFYRLHVTCRRLNGVCV